MKAFVLALALVPYPVPAVAQTTSSDAEVAAGIRQAQEGDFEAAVATLHGAARRLSADKSRARDAAIAHLYLGIAQLNLGQDAQADAALLAAVRLDPSLNPTARDFPPKVMARFQEAQLKAGVTPRREAPAAPAPAPAPKMKGGGSKGLLIGAGVLAVGGGVALAAGGGKAVDPLTTDDDRDGLSEIAGDCNDANPAINPNGAVTFTNARFETPEFTCAAGGTSVPDPVEILVDGRNNKCANLTISEASVVLTIVDLFRVSNRLGQTFPETNLPFSPAAVAAGTGGVVKVTPRFFCSDSRGPSGGAFYALTASVTLVTSGGTFTLQTTNRHRTSFPLR